MWDFLTGGKISLSVLAGASVGDSGAEAMIEV